VHNSLLGIALLFTGEQKYIEVKNKYHKIRILCDKIIKKLSIPKAHTLVQIEGKRVSQ